MPQRIALNTSKSCNLAIFELPIETPSWTVSMLWSVLSERDEEHQWLRNTIKTVASQI